MKASKRDIEDIIKNTLPFLDHTETDLAGQGILTREVKVNHARRLRKRLLNCNNMEDVVVVTKQYMIRHKRKATL